MVKRKGSNNSALHSAKREKNDEFYTQLSDIEAELRHYKKQFRGKVVFCNCDDPFESNFFKYFALNFNSFGLKKLIATCYDGSPIAGMQFLQFDDEPVANKTTRKPHKIEIEEVKDYNGDGAIDLEDVKLLLRTQRKSLPKLKGNGDFRSDECIEILKQADIVVTNPPHSLFREYVAQLMKYKKQLLIIGNVNAITYKEVFPLIKENKIWLGESIHSGDRKFGVPDYYPLDAAGCGVDENGYRFIRVKGVRWFTNIPTKTSKRHEELTLYKAYTPKEYPKYDNYDAIEVGKVVEIPMDYDGVMGVPITFLDKYNPNQFEILGITDRQNTSSMRTKKYTLEDTPRFNDLNARSVIKVGNDYKAIYARILIKKRKS